MIGTGLVLWDTSVHRISLSQDFSLYMVFSISCFSVCEVWRSLAIIETAEHFWKWIEIIGNGLKLLERIEITGK